MSMWQIILGVLVFAVITAVLYVWGLKKSVTQTQDLTKQLTNKCANKVVKLLKKQGTVTEKDIITAVTGVKAHQAWSKKYVGVQQPKDFAKTLINWMISQQLIEKCSGGYCLTKE